jgi:cullin 2
MVESDNRKDLGLMYSLLKPLSSGLNILAETLELHIKKDGLESVRNLKPETAHMDFVESVTLVYKKYKEIVNTVFNSDQMFISALDKACTAIINLRSCPKTPCRSPELVGLVRKSIQCNYINSYLLNCNFFMFKQLAKYCDTLLRKSTKGYSEVEIDERLGQSIIIFRFM